MDQVFDSFKKWETLFENQINKKIKVLRTGNWLEFCNKQFFDYYKLFRTLRHRTCIDILQQNDLAERMDKTILNKDAY